MNQPSSAPVPSAPSTPVQGATLRTVVGLLVPASPDGHMPSAASLPDVLRHVEDVVAALPAMGEALEALERDAVARFGAGFAVLDHASASALLTEFAARQPALLQRLGLETVTAYYQQDAVLERLGLEARAPYPIGFKVPAGDLTLLSPVTARGRIYRDAP